jgi:thiamine pyrophosphokinase
MLNKQNTFTLPINTTVSLIPLSENVKGITTKGLYYPLSGETLRCDRARGISNLVSDEKVEITMESGELLLVINFQEYQDVEELINRF